MNYANTAKRVQRQLKRAGMAVTLTRITPGTYDPSTGSVTNTEATYSASGVVVSYTQGVIDGTIIQAGDQRVYMDAVSGTAPQTGDKLAIAGVTYTVVNAYPVSPAGIAVLFDVQARA